MGKSNLYFYIMNIYSYKCISDTEERGSEAI